MEISREALEIRVTDAANRDQPSISVELSVALGGSVAKVDPAQIAILKKLSFQQRFKQGCSISNLASRIVANRIRQKNPKLSLAEAHRLAVQKRAPCRKSDGLCPVNLLS